MRFFFLERVPAEFSGPWQPPEALLRHLKALRISPEEAFLLLLPRGGALRARLAGGSELVLEGLAEMPRLPLLPVTLATAWPKGTRADTLVVRAAEAGVERIIPLLCERSVAGRKAITPARRARWQKLMRETCQQCGRPVAPSLDSEPVPLRSVQAECPVAHPVVLVPGSWPLGMELVLHTPREVLLLVGPEGGFSASELEWLAERGVHRAGLLPTVLRVESAGPTAVAICQHWFSQLPSR